MDAADRHHCRHRVAGRRRDAEIADDRRQLVELDQPPALQHAVDRGGVLVERAGQARLGVAGPAQLLGEPFEVHA
jgi:hypothetical protein